MIPAACNGSGAGWMVAEIAQMRTAMVVLRTRVAPSVIIVPQAALRGDNQQALHVRLRDDWNARRVVYLPYWVLQHGQS